MKKYIYYTMLVAMLFCWHAWAAEVIKDYSKLGKFAGKVITAEGKVSNIHWQRIMAYPEGYKHDTLFDMGKGQTVLYSKEKISCKGAMAVIGKVLEVGFTPKKHDGKKTKISDPGYKEYHIVVDKWKCKD